MIKFKDLSRSLSVFQALFKANFNFKDFSRQSCLFKYSSSLCKPCYLVRNPENWFSHVKAQIVQNGVHNMHSTQCMNLLEPVCSVG